MLLLCGCSFRPSIGPTIATKTVYVDATDSNGRPVKIGRIAKNVKLPIEIVTKDGIVEDEIDVGGWQVSPPAKAEVVPLK